MITLSSEQKWSCFLVFYFLVFLLLYRSSKLSRSHTIISALSYHWLAM